MVPQSRDKLKYKVEKYLQQIEGEEGKEANLKVVANAYIKQEQANSHVNSNHRDHHDIMTSTIGTQGTHLTYFVLSARMSPGVTRTRCMQLRKHLHRWTKKKRKYYDYEKRKTHDTDECTVLRKEMDEKNLTGNLIAIAKDLRSKFDDDQRNTRDRKNGGQRQIKEKILTIVRPLEQSDREEEDSHIEVLLKNIINISFSLKYSCMTNWNPRDPLVINGLCAPQENSSSVNR